MASVVRWISFLFSLAVFVVLTMFFVAKAYGWYENVGATPGFLIRVIILGLFALVAAIFPVLVVIRPGFTSRSIGGYVAIVVLSVVWVLVAGFVIAVMSGGF
jgi:hypothetical protein